MPRVKFCFAQLVWVSSRVTPKDRLKGGSNQNNPLQSFAKVSECCISLQGPSTNVENNILFTVRILKDDETALPPFLPSTKISNTLFQ